MADMDSTEVRQRVTDIKEWIFEAVERIGAPMQYATKESGVDSPILKYKIIKYHYLQIYIHLKALHIHQTKMARGDQWTSLLQ